MTLTTTSDNFIRQNNNVSHDNERLKVRCAKLQNILYSQRPLMVMHVNNLSFKIILNSIYFSLKNSKFKLKKLRWNSRNFTQFSRARSIVLMVPILVINWVRCDRGRISAFPSTLLLLSILNKMFSSIPSHT